MLIVQATAHLLRPSVMEEKSYQTLDPQFKGLDLDTLTGSYLNEPEINHGRLDTSGINCFFDIMKEISQMVSNDQGQILYNVFFLCHNCGQHKGTQHGYSQHDCSSLLC
jgi:hypothetical protein